MSTTNCTPCYNINEIFRNKKVLFVVIALNFCTVELQLHRTLIFDLWLFLKTTLQVMSRSITFLFLFMTLLINLLLRFAKLRPENFEAEQVTALLLIVNK